MKADGVVLEELKDGKVMPFQRDWAFQSAMNDLDSFTLWLKTAPQVVPMGEIGGGGLPKTERHRTRVQELMGLSAEDIAKYGNIVTTMETTSRALRSLAKRLCPFRKVAG